MSGATNSPDEMPFCGPDCQCGKLHCPSHVGASSDVPTWGKPANYPGTDSWQVWAPCGCLVMTPDAIQPACTVGLGKEPIGYHCPTHGFAFLDSGLALLREYQKEKAQ